MNLTGALITSVPVDKSFFDSFRSFRSALLKVSDLIGTQFRLGKPYRRRGRNHYHAVDQIKPIDTGNYTFQAPLFFQLFKNLLGQM